MVKFQKTFPILRIFSVKEAKEFFVGFLGFAVDWEHHSEENTPAYLQVSRAGLTLHLSEHHGDACPYSTVFVWMTGIEEFHRVLNGKGYKYLRPGIETTFYNSRAVGVIDPFGSRVSAVNPTINTPPQGRTVAVVGDVYRFLATGKDTNGRYALWEAVVPPGGGPPRTSTAGRRRGSN